MQLILADIAGIASTDNSAQDTAVKMTQALNRVIENYADDFVQDMTHISEAANYAGNINVDAVTHIKENVFRCEYSYDWTIAWTCSGLDESGRVSEKVRFTLNENGVLEFQFLNFDR